jgi:endonuclease G, mitochondrial
VFKAQVHDQDTDDSAPDTDALFADYVWSFTVATGTAPPYPPEVHLTMGNPSEAVADVLSPNNYLMMKPEYALSYNRDRGGPNWVSWHLTDEWVGNLSRVDTFRPDPAVPPDWYRVQAFDFAGSGFDRGHMVPNADRDKETSIPINQATFLMSNMVPQAPDNNQGPWANLENYLRTLLPTSEVYIVAGGAGIGGTGSSGFVTTLADGHITVPASTWKVALVLDKASGDDVSRVSAKARTIAVVMPNTQGIRTNVATDWQNYLTTVDAVEALTHYDFFSSVPEIVQNSIEAGVNGDNPPGVANQIATTREDEPVAVTLEAVSPNDDPLTYTVVGAPSHGALTGTGSSVTYVPAGDFNGTDSFSFRVSDLTRDPSTCTRDPNATTCDSNVGTVTISVLEVNDDPTAGDDTTSTNDDTAVSFPAAALTANDTAGPANESGQTLTVTAVTAGAETHGTVTLVGGQVTYTPAAHFSGPASFTYLVCDNGFTARVPESRCATGTVHLSVLDTTPPDISPLSPSATEVWPPNHKMVDIAVGYTASDFGDPAPVCVLGVSSNEPVDGTGDGDIAPDWEVVDAHHVRLRAERAGSGNGRIYTIVASCHDRAGNTSQRSAAVTVPKSQGKAK